MMLELSKMQKEIRHSVTAFAKGEFEKENCLEMDKRSLFPVEQHKKAGETGFLGVHFPEVFDGGALGAVENSLIAEALCKKDSTTGCAIMFSMLGSDWLLKYGSDTLRHKYLPEITKGRLKLTEAFGEQTSDDNWQNIKTIAEKKDHTWLLTGRKASVINGKNSDVFVVLCRLEDNGPENNGSLGIFLVDSSTDGLSCYENQASLGLKMLKRADIVFDNLVLPEENLIQVLPKGTDSKELLRYRSEKMVQIAAMAVGIAKGAYDRTISYIKLRKQFGKKLSEFQINRHKIAVMVSQIELASLITLKAAATIDSGKTDSSLCAMAKMTATGNALMVTDEAIQLFGGYGYTTDYEVERYYRDAKVLELIGGSSATLKEIIADRELGNAKNKR